MPTAVSIFSPSQNGGSSYDVITRESYKFYVFNQIYQGNGKSDQNLDLKLKKAHLVSN